MGNARETLARWKRGADRICVLILSTDLPEVDILIERERLRRLCAQLFPDREDLFEMVREEIVLVGSPQTCLKSIRRYQEEAGVNQFNLRISMGDMPLELAQRTVTLLGEKVLPHIL